MTIATGTKNTQPEVNGEPVVLYVTMPNIAQNCLVTFYDVTSSMIGNSMPMEGTTSTITVPNGAATFELYFEYTPPQGASQIIETEKFAIPSVSSSVSVTLNGDVTITTKS